MEPLNFHEIWTIYDDGHSMPVTGTVAEIRASKGCTVTSFVELAKKVSHLQFQNWGYVLFFRGQRQDYRTFKGKTNLEASIFRENPYEKLYTGSKYSKRLERLKNADSILLEELKARRLPHFERLKRHLILRLSILQHYEIVATNLLDVTLSLRIAASFASLENKSEEAYILVLGVPNISGAITVSADEGLQIIRLSSICPPCALRPHFQEGYLVGEYPEFREYDPSSPVPSGEFDFANKLIAKFRFNPKTFWKQDAFPLIGRDTLMPDIDDPMFELTQKVKTKLENN